MTIDVESGVIIEVDLSSDKLLAALKVADMKVSKEIE